MEAVGQRVEARIVKTNGARRLREACEGVSFAVVTEIPLTPRLAAKLAALFPVEDRLSAERRLVAECGSNLPFADTLGPTGIERVRAAALKLSQGSLDRLAQGTALGRRDWRDLLMAADFGHDIHAHETWLSDPPSSN